MTIIDPHQPILVTGANGYLGSWIIQYLLDAGHTVHGTVRDPQHPKVAHLHDMAKRADGRLTLFAADLLQEGSFDAAMQGCELVLHTASPFLVSNYTSAQEQLIRPALQGTRHVLAAVERTASVRRVVLTSSVAAIYGDACDIKQAREGQFTEEMWNITSREDHQPYQYSKMLAEREAWEWVKRQTRWDLVCINPALIMGPALTKHSQSASISILQEFGQGTLRFGAPKMWNGLVDVRDVALAHIRAAFTPAAQGRYIICERTLSLLQMGQALAPRYGEQYPMPKYTVPTAAFWLVAPMYGYTREFVQKNMGFPIDFDATRSQIELGINYRDVRQSLVEHFAQLIDDGLL